MSKYLEYLLKLALTKHQYTTLVTMLKREARFNSTAQEILDMVDDDE